MKVDEKFAQLAQWIEQRNDVPISQRFADYLLPKIRTGKAGTLQFEPGSAASAFAKDSAARRLSRPDGMQRTLFVRTADAPFDNNGRLLAIEGDCKYNGWTDPRRMWSRCSLLVSDLVYAGAVQVGDGRDVGRTYPSIEKLADPLVSCCLGFADSTPELGNGLHDWSQ